MEAWMIIILVIGGILALAFNIWNKKNPPKKIQQQQPQNYQSPPPPPPPPAANQSLTPKQLRDLQSYEEYKRQQQQESTTEYKGALYDSDGKRIR